jgi:type IV pilus assembly protein PilA
MGRFSKTLAKMMRGKQKGFTLIELLIVVAILGILAAVIIPNVAGFMVTGKLNAANTEVENVKTAGLAYYAEYSSWPTTADNWTLLKANFLSGAPKADYLFNATGFIEATPAKVGTSYDGIQWQLGSASAHGHWKR